ncbi:MAG: GSCFA domain-containing protein, partial [Actinomycetaceae bacterium]|nr:GSCFA domain-containing protein [Actinomycetaceae bacterium]
MAFIGSCFAETIGQRMRQSGLPALVNPFGVLYNPMSILQAIAQNPSFDSLYFQDASGRWHCWLADSSFDASTLDACKAGLLSARGRLFAWQPDTIVFTLGTTHFYEHARMV